MSFLIILTISTVYVTCTEFKKHVPNSAYPYDIDVPKYNVEYWAKQLHLQQCAFVEVGDKYYAIFVETRPRQYDKDDEIREYFLGLCDDDTLNKWSFCSTNLENKRSKDCSFVSNNTSGTRVHRRLCDVTLLANNAPQCNCNYDLSESRLFKVQGFPTCFKAPLPDSLCGDNNVCGLAACTPETINDRIHSVICDRKCNHHQPFCEAPNKRSSQPREITSFWTDWSNPFCTDSSCISQFDEATCINKETGEGDIDCLGPGTSCCTPDLENCKCHVYEEDGSARVFRTFSIPPPELIEYMTEEDFINSIPLRHLTREEFHKFPFGRLARSSIGAGFKNVILKLYESRPIKFGNKHTSRGSRRHRLDEIKKRFLKGLRQLQGRDDDTKRKRMVGAYIYGPELHPKRSSRHKYKGKRRWNSRKIRGSKEAIKKQLIARKHNLFLPVKKQVDSGGENDDYSDVIINIKGDHTTEDNCFCGYSTEKTTTKYCSIPSHTENCAYKELLVYAVDTSTAAYNKKGFSYEDIMAKLRLKEDTNLQGNILETDKKQKIVRCGPTDFSTESPSTNENKTVEPTSISTPKQDDLDDALKAEEKLDLERDRKAEVEDDIFEEKISTLETSDLEVRLHLNERVTPKATKAEDEDAHILATTTTESLMEVKKRSKTKEIEINEDLDDKSKYPMHVTRPTGDDEDYDLNTEKPNKKSSCANFGKFNKTKRGNEQQVLSDDDDDEDDTKDDIAIEYADGEKISTTMAADRGQIKSLNAERFSEEIITSSGVRGGLRYYAVFIHIFLIYIT